MSNEEAVLVYLRGDGLPDAIYEQYDLATLEDQLIESVAKDELGEFDGHEFGESETILYLYAPDAEKLFTGIEPLLRAYPLCQGARVIVRSGPPGALEREVVLD